ncbi:telomere repeats-binding bouquet formation protein 2-like [Liolophura sinensis]|uniref:telomere repeats-binding bouquet formation protein 2-like n=1 Tax=Liolophura sinensis TaxID=3198878 RepID=UPI0031593BC9
MTESEGGIFNGLTAWFSTSVRKKRRKIWEKEGGEVTPFDTAEFFFSENAEAEDTEWIYKSDDYERDHISVFHSMYIEKCKSMGSTADVKLGDYFLPPADIQELARKQVHYKWEIDEPADQEEVVSDSEGRVGSPVKRRSTSHKGTEHQNAPGSCSCAGAEKVPKYEGPLTEFQPGKNGNEVFCVLR